jgi:hypothetical protein
MMVLSGLQQLQKGSSSIKNSIGCDIHSKTLTLQTTFNRLRWFLTSEFAPDRELSMRRTPCFGCEAQATYFACGNLVLHREGEVIGSGAFILKEKK